MIDTDADVLVVMPCDSPLIKAEHLQKLLATRANNDADVAVAFDGERLHPVFLAIKTSLKTSLEDYLASGQRKMDRWLELQKMVKADFSNEPEIFTNINTLTELSELEAKKENHSMHIGHTISSVQAPIIPVIGEWTRDARFFIVGPRHGCPILLLLAHYKPSAISVNGRKNIYTARRLGIRAYWS